MPKNKILLNAGWLFNGWTRIINHPELQQITDWEYLDASNRENIIQVIVFEKKSMVKYKESDSGKVFLYY
ncbi:MAG: hypothetical protein WCP19_14160, partial [Chloroflexota bacterium]